MLEIFSSIVITLLFAATFPGTLELCLVSFGALLPKRKKIVKFTTHQKMAVLIPAHNEEKTLSQTLQSLKANDETCSIIVIADNCTDNTANIAQEFGAKVINRTDPVNRGKHCALEFAFNQLKDESFDCYLIIDADSIVSENCIHEVMQAFSQGFEAIQIRYGVKCPVASLRHRLMRVAFLAFNYLRPRGRSRLGLSCGIFGNGFGITKKLLEKIPFQVNSVVEDLAYHLKIVEGGSQVQFIERAVVYGEIPVGEKGALTQRVRWEGGRLMEVKRNLPILLRKIFQGQWKLLEPTLDLLLLPLGYHVLLLIALLVMSTTLYYGLIGVGIVGVHVVLAIVLGGGGIKDFFALLIAPIYILWKFGALFLTFVKLRKGMVWEKTQRD